MYLRHQVVLTTLEEDFKAIGLLKDDEPQAQPVMEEDEPIETDDADDLAEDTEPPVDRAARRTAAQEFSELFDTAWDRWDAEGVDDVSLSEEDMEELDSFAEDTHTLSAEEEAEEEETEKAVSAALDKIEKIANEGISDSVAEATAALKEIKLIAGLLEGFFAETHELTEDEDYAAIAEVFAEMVAEADGLLKGLAEQSEASVDFDELRSGLGSYLETLAQGLETYIVLNEDEEAEQAEDEDEEQAEDEDEEQAAEEDEGKE